MAETGDVEAVSLLTRRSQIVLMPRFTNDRRSQIADEFVNPKYGVCFNSLNVLKSPLNWAKRATAGSQLTG